MGHDLQQEIGLAHQHVAFANLWPGTDHFLELLKVGLGLACQPDKGKNLNGVAKGFGIKIGVITADDALILENADAAKTGRCRDAGTFCQIDIGHPPIILKIIQDLPVNRVELYFSGHAVPIRFILFRGAGNGLPRAWHV